MNMKKIMWISRDYTYARARLTARHHHLLASRARSGAIIRRLPMTDIIEHEDQDVGPSTKHGSGNVQIAIGFQSKKQY